MSTPTIHEYAFDVTLFAVIRVKATTEANAREAMDRVLSCMDLSEFTIDGMNDEMAAESLQITEASLSTADGEPHLFELDGVEQEAGDCKFHQEVRR